MSYADVATTKVGSKKDKKQKKIEEARNTDESRQHAE